MVVIRFGNGRFYPIKEGPTLKPSSSKVTRMSKLKFFYTDAFERMWPPHESGSKKFQSSSMF